jgi:DNA-binding NarL/FixJ family response regulator
MTAQKMTAQTLKRGPTAGSGQNSRNRREIIDGLIHRRAKGLWHRELYHRARGEALAKRLLHIEQILRSSRNTGKTMPIVDINRIKVTPRDQQVISLLVQGCSNKEIAAQLQISPRTVKQHLRTLFLRAGIRDGRKRVKLATAMFAKEQMEPCNHVTG